jgi:hypothetical protein
MNRGRTARVALAAAVTLLVLAGVPASGQT